MCGEGGEYESAVFDCLLFKDKKIEILESEIIHHVDNDIAPVAYLQFKKLAIVKKSEEEKQEALEVI